MTDKKKRGRVKIGQPKGEANELTTDELKHVKGGHSGGVNVALGDGSVRFVKSTTTIQDGTSNITDGTSKIADGTSNTIMIGEQKV